jgi:deoxyhypusine synthase
MVTMDEKGKVKDLVPRKQTVDELVRQMKGTAFNGRQLAEATDIVEAMVKEKGCAKFLGLSGALVPAGMRACVVEMIKSGWVDTILTTGANMTHDMSIGFGEHYIQCEPDESKDEELRKKQISRIYDVLSPDKTSEAFETGMQKILSDIGEGSFATYELMKEVGGRLEDENSIVRAAAKHNVKIIIPAFFDSIFGFQVWMYSQEKKLVIDERKDLDYMINTHYGLKDRKCNSGALILGGGVPKNYILQSVLIPEKPHKYVVQVTSDVPQFGGLSGATLSEAISWGKVTKESRLCTVHCDATIAFPIIISALKERFG